MTSKNINPNCGRDGKHRSILIKRVSKNKVPSVGLCMKQLVGNYGLWRVERRNVLVIPRLHRSNLSKLATRKLAWPSLLGVNWHLELSFHIEQNVPNKQERCTVCGLAIFPHQEEKEKLGRSFSPLTINLLFAFQFLTTQDVTNTSSSLSYTLILR